LRLFQLAVGRYVTPNTPPAIKAQKWLRHATGETTIAQAKAEFLLTARRSTLKMTVATGETTIAKAGWFFCFSSPCRNRSTQFQQPMIHPPLRQTEFYLTTDSSHKSY
jgi:hypothetical protein